MKVYRGSQGFSMERSPSFELPRVEGLGCDGRFVNGRTENSKKHRNSHEPLETKEHKVRETISRSINGYPVSAHFCTQTSAIAKPRKSDGKVLGMYPSISREMHTALSSPNCFPSGRGVSSRHDTGVRRTTLRPARGKTLERVRAYEVIRVTVSETFLRVSWIRSRLQDGCSCVPTLYV